MAASGRDSDHWTQGTAAGDEADGVSFTWTASGGQLASSSGPNVDWTAPSADGSYTLTCTVDDTGTTRFNDAAKTASVTIVVDSSAPTLSLKSARSTVVAGPGCDYNHTTLTATLKKGDGSADAGQSVTFALREGDPATLTDTSNAPGPLSVTVTTDANGEAKATLTSRDEYGVSVEVKATHAGLEGKTTVDIEPPDGNVVVQPRSSPLIADGKSIADVILTLKYGGKPVTGHSIAWRISKVLNAEGQAVTTPGDDYGTLVESEKIPNSNGEYFRKFITGTKAGTIFFEAVDKSVKKYKAPSQNIAGSTIQANAENDEGNPVFETTADDEADVTPPPPAVKFEEYPLQKYGFDDYTYPNATPSPPCISVKVGDTNTATAVIDPSSRYNEVFFKSTNAAVADCSPTQATSGMTHVDVHGIGEGHSIIQANHFGKDGPTIAKLNVAAYRLKRRTLAIRVVHEENDDEQIIPFMGTGSPQDICIRAGANLFRDTVPAGDDVVDATGLNIMLGGNGMCDTRANNTNVLSGHTIDPAQLQVYLNNIFKQAVLEWEVTELPAIAVNFDLDRDGGFDATSEATPEWGRVIDTSRPIDEEYDDIIYIVRQATKTPTGQPILGVMGYGKHEGFVFAGNYQVVAHELGHGPFNLQHVCQYGKDGGLDRTQDPHNLMFPEAGDDRDKLRNKPSKSTSSGGQWDYINGRGG